MNVEQLQDKERRMLQKLNARAERIRAADPSISLETARGMATEQMPNTARQYLEVRSRLGLMGVRPLMFDEA